MFFGRDVIIGIFKMINQEFIRRCYAIEMANQVAAYWQIQDNKSCVLSQDILGKSIDDRFPQQPAFTVWSIVP